MAHVHMCMCFCAAISAFAAAPVAKPRVTEFWLCALVFPSLMSPGSCLSLTPLFSVSQGPHSALLSASCFLCCMLPCPYLRKECIVPNLYFPLVCAICNSDFSCVKWNLIAPQGYSSLSAFPKSLSPVEAQTLNIVPTSQPSPALPAPCTALAAPLSPDPEPPPLPQLRAPLPERLSISLNCLVVL